MAPQAIINWAIYSSLPPKEAQYQLAHVNDNKRGTLAATYIVCVPILFLAVVMRFVSRRIGRIEYRADDWTMVVGLLLAIADIVSCSLAAFVYGGARHVILMTENDPVRFAKSDFAAGILYGPTIGIVKISTLLLFARIFQGRNFKRVLWAVGLFISMYSAIMTITIIFQCRPKSRIWDRNIEAECIDVKKVWIVMNSMNVLTDFLLLCLPLPQLWKMQMRHGTKLQVIGIFSIGSLTTVVSIYRIPQLRSLSMNSYDPSWSNVEPIRWSIVEIVAATLGACAITYRPLFNWVFRIQSSEPGRKSKLPQADVTKSSSVSTRTASVSKIGTNIKMQALDVIHPPFPASPHNTQMPNPEDGLIRIRDSTEV